MKFFTRAILGLLFFSAIIQVKAQFEYTNVNGSITITRYTGPGGAVVIPALIDGLPVTGLAAPGFLADLTVTSVEIPASVTNIQAGCFEYCFSLTGINVDQANQWFTSSGGVLFDASQATLLQYPGGFSGSYTIPAGVTTIGDHAFFANFLSNISIPSTVTNIGPVAFAYCPFLTSIQVDPRNPSYASVDGVLFDYAQATLIQYPGNLSGAYVVPPTVVSIGSYAFEYSFHLTSVELPTSVTSIGVQAFSHCNRLQAVNVDPGNGTYSSLNGVLFDLAQDVLLYYPSGLPGGYSIPSGVISIGANAFDFASVTSLALPATLASVGPLPFFDCASLLSITVDPANPTYSSLNGVLFDKTQATLIIYPDGLTGSYMVPNGVATIGPLAFLYSLATTITVPASVTSLQAEAFAECARLSSVTFLGNQPAIDPTAFLDDSNLQLIYLPGVTGWTSPVAGIPALLWNAASQSAAVIPGIQNQSFGFTIKGTAGLNVLVQGCTNLAAPVWLPLQTLTLTNGSALYSQPLDTTVSAGFFRLSTP